MPPWTEFSYQISHHPILINVKTVATFRPAILLAGPPNAQRLRSRTLSMESAAACLLDSPSKSLMNLTSISDSWLILMWSSFFCPPTSWSFRCFHVGFNLEKKTAWRQLLLSYHDDHDEILVCLFLVFAQHIESKRKEI